MPRSSPRYKIGLAANRTHQDAADSALVRLLRDGREAIESYLRPRFFVVGRTLDAMKAHDLLPGYQSIERFPYGREGGLMMLVSRIVEADTEKSLDAIIYLMDPVDPSSNFPEALALKRQCVIHGKPFLSTLAGAREWLELEAVAIGAAPDPTLDPTFDLAAEG
ncbi:MAG: methylglyoxal synthase, partial [Burkholderiaceae bacterium]